MARRARNASHWISLASSYPYSHPTTRYPSSDVANVVACIFNKLQVLQPSKQCAEIKWLADQKWLLSVYMS